jgi:glutathione synthase/RimK-type ligase-like ATP-grasp enzyme
MRIAIATTEPLPEPDPDQELLLAALRAAGAEAEMLSWCTSTADPASFDLVVLRSTWDSHWKPAAFRSWCERTGARTRLLNPARTVAWNLHKSYLRDLAERGVPIVPTAWVECGERADLEDIVRELGGAELVIKPAISAGSWKTRRFAAAERDAARAFLTELAREADAMVQPYLRSTETTGERALIWIDGELTHAVRKSPRFSGEDESVSAALQPSEEERAFAARTLEAAAQPGLLYARVDVMRGDDGELLLSELELIEPSLFLKQHPPASERLARAIVARAR